VRDDFCPTRRRDLCRLTITNIEVFGVERYLVICRNFRENSPAGEDCGLVKGVSVDVGPRCLGAHLVAVLTGAHNASIFVDEQYKAIALPLGIHSAL